MRVQWICKALNNINRNRHLQEKQHFINSLYSWHLDVERNLPWKEDRDPYKIWVSEIILQQTRVVQGLPYYLRFVDKWPTIASFAVAREDEVLKMWEGLGYYSRARNMMSAARQVMQAHHGVFPESIDDILKLKGIGPYTGAAIASFAFKTPIPVMDGNVMRVISRIYGIDLPIDTSEGKTTIKHKLEGLIDTDEPDKFNQAIMDFGALHCTPQNPRCESCVFSDQCEANASGLTTLLPIKSKLKKKRVRNFQYLIIENQNKIAIGKRNAKDIWRGLYEFPMLETSKINVSNEEISDHLRELGFIIEKEILVDTPIKLRSHMLTHQLIEAKIYKIRGNFELNINNAPYFFVSKENLDNFAFPKLLQSYLAKEEFG